MQRHTAVLQQISLLVPESHLSATSERLKGCGNFAIQRCIARLTWIAKVPQKMRQCVERLAQSLCRLRVTLSLLLAAEPAIQQRELIVRLAIPRDTLHGLFVQADGITPLAALFQNVATITQVLYVGGQIPGEVGHYRLRKIEVSLLQMGPDKELPDQRVAGPF